MLRIPPTIAFTPSTTGLTALLALLLSLGSDSTMAEGEAALDLDQLCNLRGGLDTGCRTLTKLNVAVEGESGALRYRLSAHATNNGAFSAERVGDAQTVSNLEAPEGVRPVEAWIDYDLAGLSTLVGMYDLNSEFDVIEPATLFLNSSHGIGPDISHSGQAGPSIFPFSGAGFRLHFGAEDGGWRLAVLDGVPGDPDHEKRNTIHLNKNEGALYAAEAYGQHDDWQAFLGIWTYSEPQARLDETGTAQAGGIYGALIYTPESAWQAWLRLGQARAETQDVKRYIGLGTVRSLRNGWRTGAALALAFPSDGAGLPPPPSRRWSSHYRSRSPTGSPCSPICNGSATQVSPLNSTMPGS